MCGVFAYAGQEPAAPHVLRGLYDLEYRGYDSAGIAALDPESGITVFRREGKIAALEAAMPDPAPATGLAMGHTRWATHGRPSDGNAHPHRSCDGSVAIVHNGIVENYAALRDALRAAGHTFSSETDTETVAHLLETAIDGGNDVLGALRETAGKLQGSQAIVAMSAAEPGTLVATRIGNAGGLVIGHGDGFTCLASDLAAILRHTQRVTFLQDGQFARVTAGAVEVFGADGSPVDADEREVPIDPESALKGTYETFMLKEIMEQPAALADTVQSLLSLEPLEIRLPDLASARDRFDGIQRVVLVGMGTSLHAAMIGRQYIERIAGIPAEADNASEFRHRAPILGPETLVISVSQSGETVDVLEAMAIAREAGALQVTICNTEGSQATRVADGAVYTHAGLERGVASTKCFTTAVVAIFGLALQLAQDRGRLDQDTLAEHVQALTRLPELTATLLGRRDAIALEAGTIGSSSNVLFLGRGLAFPVAMEGALKMKEISYIHAEGYAAGEMKHGPIALIEPAFQTVAIAPTHALRSKMISNIEQVQARGGPVVALVTDGDEEIAGLAGGAIAIPDAGPWLEPIIATIATQLLAYEVATARGLDVDQPRNLAKTVTVE